MNKKTLFAGLLAQAALLYVGHAPAQGQINVTGRVLDNTCTVSVPSRNQVVQMQEEAHKKFSRPGDTGTTNPFSVVLERCGSGAKAVTLNFQGTADPRNPRLLSTGTGPGRASGVAIGLYERSGTPVALNADTRKYALTGGAARVVLNFDARYVAVAVPVSPGRASGSVTFTHTYD